MEKIKNLEFYKIYKQPDIIKFVKLKRNEWAGHLARINENRCCKKIFLVKPIGNRPRGRQLLRWVATVAEWSRYRIGAGLVTSSSPVPLKTRRVG
ncbi:hypothetical protein TNCV_3972001 [Trichonephila clavipes]|nr:hypothetical protein TNCV_3972001 [Trichonephila clavipes]